LSAALELAPSNTATAVVATWLASSITARASDDVTELDDVDGAQLLDQLECFASQFLAFPTTHHLTLCDWSSTHLSRVRARRQSSTHPPPNGASGGSGTSQTALTRKALRHNDFTSSTEPPVARD